MSDKITVYITSMGETPEAVRAFISAFSARFGIPSERMQALSSMLPARIGSYDLEKAQRFGREIVRMGGRVSLRRPAASPAAPNGPAPTATPSQQGGDSWVVHGYTESQEELRAMTQSAPGVPAQSDQPDELPPGVADDVPPPPEPPPTRKIAGRYEPKQVYTTEQAFGLDEEHFKKVKGLYAGRKGKKGIAASPVFKLGIVAVIVLAGLLIYQHREEIRTSIFGVKEAVLSDAYAGRIPANVSVPDDLTGDYSGSMRYTTEEGDVADVNVTLFVDGRNVHDVIVEISSFSGEIGEYLLKVEYAPGYLTYTKTVSGKTVYTVENAFPSTVNAVGRIDDRGTFAILLDATAAGIDPKRVPSSEKDRLGNAIFLKMEGAFAGDGQFYGGLLTSGSPLVGWEASKK